MIYRKDIFGVLIPSLTIGLFAILLSTSLARLSTIEKDMRIDATQNMLWVISRSQVGSLQLQKAAALQVKGQHEAAQVARRLNNFLSHYNVLSNGPQRRQMDKMGFSDALDRIETRRGELESLTVNLSLRDEAALSRIREILGPYDAILARAANRAMVAEWDDVGGRLDRTRKEVVAITLSLVAIAIAGAGMTFHLIRASRTARFHARLLERERAFSELLVASSSEAIVATDLDLRLTIWNDAAGALFGIAADDALHRPVAGVTGFFSVDRVRDVLLQAVTGTRGVLSDLPLFADADTSPIYVDLRYFPLRHGAGIIGSIMLISDVTEQYLATRELSERRDYLEDEVLLRTQELNAALACERATTEIYRNFAAMVSHQFRTPLAIVDSALQRLMRQAGNLTTEQIVEKGGQARSAILRLVRLVETTLDVARLDNGQIDKQTKRWDLTGVIIDAVRQQSGQTPEHVFDYAGPRPLIVDCDPVHAEHIIINLLSNAVKYGLPDSVIRIEPVMQDRQAGCRVINKGHIDPSDRARLFERSFRGGNARERNGVGLGLYMARSLARLQDGDIFLEDTTDGEIAFTFVLPLAHEKHAVSLVHRTS